ncbi:predicted protein [Naegleria gruberi]|uniref:XTP/dITP diphosphatase n=1 Tax=Naegleria gruberi TaxID=5762 RepID=D2UYP5_NAEGR|nr:uncharacterized protein NAEGRDRAFT_34772 [Naegleria gruberi]EFC50513.1 predicted protein [Naegleria gruberi]|eukprot:XP_002683257.1 predicted protein [Naegleria gruberi strain NEG-M]
MLAAKKSGAATAADNKIKILFVTGNENKKKEVQQIMGEQFQVDSLAIDLPELQGEIDEISKEKCRIAIQNVLTDPKIAYKYGSEHVIVVEDTSLCFNALNGMPGPYIKWFLEKCGHEGLNKMLVEWEDDCCDDGCGCCGEVELDLNPKVIRGETTGDIVLPRSAEGPAFGWDPIFQPTGFTQTFAEMTKEQKNTISHRYKAFQALQAALLE